MSTPRPALSTVTTAPVAAAALQPGAAQPRASQSALSTPRNMLTIDVEDYFHASGLAVDRTRWAELPGRVDYTTRRLLMLLEQRHTRATFFVLGWVAEHYPDLAPAIHAAGHEIASHGYDHELVYRQTPEQFRQDIVRSKQLLEDQCGVEVVGYRAPSFSIVPRSSWALEILAAAGFRYDSSVYPISRERYGDPTAPRFVHRVLEPGPGHMGLIEIPPATVQLYGKNVPVAGGGYFRAYPLWATRRAIRHINGVERQPVMVYLHPWEIDPDQPRMPATLGNRFRHYLNLHRTEERLVHLLQEVRFGTVRDSLAMHHLMKPPSDRKQAIG